MTVYFVDRSFYDGPSGRRLFRYNADSVLTCFQAFWGNPPDPNLGVPFLAHVLSQAAEQELAAPYTMEELAHRMHDCVYTLEVVFKEHALQILSDDDEIEFAYYVFDDHYRASVPAHFTSFLLHDDWRLPAGTGGGDFVPQIAAAPLLPKGRNEGTTWFVLQMAEDSLNLTEMRYPMQIAGVRLPELCRYLAEATPAPGEPGGMDWPWELRLLRTQVADGMTRTAELRAALERTNALDVNRVERLGEWHGGG